MSSENLPAPPSPRNYSPDQITLYGTRLNLPPNAKTPELRAANLPFEGNSIRLAVVKPGTNESVDGAVGVIAVIYGYSFEGGCYRFDKPKLLIFEAINADDDDATGCGFDALGYKMWQLSKKTQIMELSTETDLAEEIVLNANLPGNRNPNTYGNSFMMAHRSGRLNRGGGNQN